MSFRFLLLTVALVFIGVCLAGENYQDLTDNEFAEFDDFETEEELISENTKEGKESSQDATEFVSDDEDQDMVIEEDDSEFEHFQDTEEFEGFSDGKDEKLPTEPKITITKVPIRFQAEWDSYWLEILMISGLVVYFINFVMGKRKNSQLANAWLQSHKQLLEENFSLVGDDGVAEMSDGSRLVKESENMFTLWCSGRTCCEGMLVELKLIKVSLQKNTCSFTLPGE